MTDETPKEPAPLGSAKPEWALTRRDLRARDRAADSRAPGQIAPKRRRWLIALLLLLALVVAAGLWLRGQAPLAEGEPAVATTPEGGDRRLILQVTPDELIEVQPLRLRDTVKVTGSLAPQRQVHIAAEVSGRLEEVFFRAGDNVPEGAQLVQVDIETLRNQLEQQRATTEATRAQLTLAQNQLERTRSLVNRGLTASSELEIGQAGVDQLTASLAAQNKQVETAQSSLRHAEIAAPFAGMISERLVDPGAYVAPGAELMTLVDLSRMEYEAAVPVRYAPQMRAGQNVEVTVEGIGDAKVLGQIDRISPVAIAGTRMLPVYVVIDNADLRLRGGMFAAGELILEEKRDAIGLPFAAVHQDDSGSYVLRKAGDLIERADVGIARTWDGGRMVEIASGLAPGDVIVGAALEQLRPGAQVQIVGE
ncbi:efflux RND transporter periplasmic adaptor subunit [Pseudooceanicola algae]|uniref:Macrolide export protein MacA n=1 Tax=Pseudooceanicola algae TaxID=1537215 RepID=A0A418SJV7_9RHOB|nr:efflux RND transporter periplasmic adaptor subunit [Pseudooceanicola algae]QPM88807.1 Macrolide export protein MacA [Pseudooceanicola algae]